MGKLEPPHPAAVGTAKKFFEAREIEGIPLPLLLHADELHGRPLASHRRVERGRKERHIHGVDPVPGSHAPEALAKRPEARRKGRNSVKVADAVVVHPIGDGDGKLGEHPFIYEQRELPRGKLVFFPIEEADVHRMLPDGFALIADRHPKRIDARSFEREGQTVEGKERIGEETQPLCDDVVVPLRMIAKLPGDIPHAAHLAGKIAPDNQAAVLEREPLVDKGKLKGDGFVLKAGSLPPIGDIRAARKDLLQRMGDDQSDLLFAHRLPSCFCEALSHIHIEMSRQLR